MKKSFNILLIPFFAFLFMNSTCANPKCEDTRTKKSCDKQREIMLGSAFNLEQQRLNELREPEPNENFDQAVCSDFMRLTSRYISNSDTSKDKDYYYTNLKSSKFKVMRLKEEQTGISFKVYSNKQNRISVSPSSTLVELTSSTNGKKYQVLLEEYDAGTETFVYFAFEAPTKNSSILYIPHSLPSSILLSPNINADSFFSPDGNPLPYSYFEGEFTCSP